MQDEERDAWMRLKLTPGVGDATARKLLAAFGLPPALFAQPQAALRRGRRSGAGRTAARARGLARALRAHLGLAGRGRRPAAPDHAGRPGLSGRTAADRGPAAAAACRGRPAALRHPLRLAIVGSRNPTARAPTMRAFSRRRWPGPAPASSRGSRSASTRRRTRHWRQVANRWPWSAPDRPGLPEEAPGAGTAHRGPGR